MIITITGQRPVVYTSEGIRLYVAPEGETIETEGRDIHGPKLGRIIRIEDRNGRINEFKTPGTVINRKVKGDAMNFSITEVSIP